MYSTLITVEQLQALQSSGQPLMVFDCSFDLTQPLAGRAMFQDSHIAGAVYADLNTDLEVYEDDRVIVTRRDPMPGLITQIITAAIP